MLQVPATIENARKVRRLCVKHGLNMDKSLNDMLNSIPLATKLPGFNFTLHDFQAQGVAWLEAQGGRGILADEQGTCLLYTSPSPRDRTRSRMPSSA